MIVAGFGFRARATPASLQAALEQAAPDGTIDALATPVDKAQTDCMVGFANDLGLPVHPICADALQTASPATQSAHSLARRGTGSVAEACALAAAGPGARLLVSRHISPDRLATCAIAIGTDS
ncbi:cobalamin biosynthesis protein [Rhodobacteraceae bacterium F11138]|nr:cobalamin biosynthesis protein [Rhodobacteraceae bacterium F11138]